MNNLVGDCPPLDPNSLYCNLLQCTHFRDTCVAAEQSGQLVGFISAYILPARPDTLFVWQVAVSPRARGQGLALRMLEGILARPYCESVSWLETTITPDNEASAGLFRRLADNREAGFHQSVSFDRDRHFGGRHDSELLTRIGPLGPPRVALAQTRARDNQHQLRRA